MTRTLTKSDIEWNRHPEGFECRLRRMQEVDPETNQPVIVWYLTTGYDVLTDEGERIHQDERWSLPAQAVTVAEGIRSRVVARIKQRNDIP